MRLLIVNSFFGVLSTGRICAQIADEYRGRGWEVRAVYGRGTLPERYREIAIHLGTRFSLLVNIFLCRVFDLCGTGVCSYFATKRFIRWAEEWHPDMVWIHNVHGYYINWALLFGWLGKHPEIKVKWTLHDCWPITGHCCYFQMVDCDRWHHDCARCPGRRFYPKTLLFSRSRRNLAQKKKLLAGIEDMELIVPSKWLGGVIKESFLGKYPVRVVNNKVDQNVFYPRKVGKARLSEILKSRERLEGKVTILGVANGWEERKGLGDFLALRQMLDERFVIILVGLTERQIKAMPKGVVGLARTNNAGELAELYSSVDFFFNPTKEDNYPTVNLEAVACGCKVVTYDTGGCRETVENAKGAVVLTGEDKSPSGFVRMLRR